MTVGYRNSAGVDFDSLFDPYVQGTPPAATGFRDSANVDLAGRYAPIAFGTKGPDVGYRNAAGVDLSNLWAAFGTASYGVPAGFDGQNYVHSRQAPATATITLSIRNDGTWAVTGNPGSTKATGDWLTLAGGGSVADYEVIFSSVTTAGAPTISNGAATYQPLSTTRGISATVSGSDVFGVIDATCHIRHIATGAERVFGTCELWTETLVG